MSKDNHIKSSFRIIALRVLAGCELHIKRALKEKVTYFLCNDYEDQYFENQYYKDDNWKGISKKNNEECALPNGFFMLSEIEGQQKPSISISAIVGKNGDGKSSLVELMLRIIYNFGIAYGFIANKKLFAHIQGVEAILYYEINGVLYSIKCSRGKTEASFAKRVDKETLKQHSDFLFYSIVANYSIYAYNSRNFEREAKDDKSWIDKTFHHDDSYQTPLVLNPMRTEGNVDVNLDEYLSSQRLMALYADMGEDESARIINDNKRAAGFAFNLEKKSKIETSTLRQYFQSTWKSTALMMYSNLLKGYLYAINTSEDTIARKSFDRQQEFWLQYSKYWAKYKYLFYLAQKVIQQIYKEKNADYNSDEKTDLSSYLNEATRIFDAFVEKDDDRKTLLESLKTVSKLTSKMTGLQFQLLVLIIDVCELWSKHLGFSTYDFSNAFQQYVNKKDTGENRAQLYIIYITISFFLQDRRFQNLLDVNMRYFYLFDFEDNREYTKILGQAFGSLFKDKGKQQIVNKYDTLKLRQTINYLRCHSFKSNRKEDKLIENSKVGFNHFVTFKSLNENINMAKKICHEETIALLPPPIFEGEILVEDQNGQENQNDTKTPKFKMSDLSSGELQMLSSISTYIYHLRNINDAREDIKYSYVNLILEEVELYFHPEYQRQYVYRMLRQIKQAKLDNIKAINIILVTHSPFVLSDIPKNNVLFLKDGKPVHIMQENTFGANIHSLLKNGFFLDGVPMGEFANKKINKMFERLHNGDYSDELFEEIKLVSEPLLKTQLYRLFALNKLPFDNDSDAKILYGDLLKRIKQLEDKLNDKH